MVLFGGDTVIGTHSRSTRQLLAYAQKRYLASGLFCDFLVTEAGGWLETQGPLRKSGPCNI
jgi:hypothetical protein